MGASVSTDFMNMFANDWFLLSDFADFFCGDIVGEGTERSVYEFRLDPSMVIKIDRSRQFSNVSEWDVWTNVSHHYPDYAKYLAPCVHISSCGRVMLQMKTTPVERDKLPESIPAFFTDYKIQNWGMLEDRVVCHDYANHTFFSNKVGMMSPEWWSDTYQVVKDEVRT